MLRLVVPGVEILVEWHLQLVVSILVAVLIAPLGIEREMTICDIDGEGILRDSG